MIFLRKSPAPPIWFFSKFQFPLGTVRFFQFSILNLDYLSLAPIIHAPVILYSCFYSYQYRMYLSIFLPHLFLVAFIDRMANPFSFCYCSENTFAGPQWNGIYSFVIPCQNHSFKYFSNITPFSSTRFAKVDSVTPFPLSVYPTRRIVAWRLTTLRWLQL